MNRYMTVALLAAAVSIVGCTDNSPATQTLVVDPVPVAKSLGRDEVIKQRLDAAVERINAQLQQHSDKVLAQIEKEKAKLGKSPDDASTADYQALVAAASENIQQTQLLARRKAADYRAALLAEFNTELRTVAADIARERGADHVLVVDDSVLWFDAASDITADVIARLRAKAADMPARAAESPAAKQGDAGTAELKELEKLVEEIERKEQDSSRYKPGNK